MGVDTAAIPGLSQVTSKRRRAFSRERESTAFAVCVRTAVRLSMTPRLWGVVLCGVMLMTVVLSGCRCPERATLASGKHVAIKMLVTRRDSLPEQPTDRTTPLNSCLHAPGTLHLIVDAGVVDSIRYWIMKE